MLTSTHTSKSENRSTGTVVIGFGNLLLKDEGVGIHIIQSFREMALADNSKLVIMDGGTCPDILYLLPEGVGKLIIVDAVKGGGMPGDIYRFTPNDFTFSRMTITSVHQLGIAEGLRGLELLDANPKEVIIIGVEPKEVGWGLEISPELKEILPQVVDLLVKEIYNTKSVWSSAI
ncbi:hydrogenase maturation protease [Chloroflexota bacterium]